MDLRALLAEHLTAPMSWPMAAGLGVFVVVLLEVLYRIIFRWLRVWSALLSPKLERLVRRMRWPAQILVFLLGVHVVLSARSIESAALSKAVTIVELVLFAYLVIEAFEAAVLDFWLSEKRKVNVPNVVRGLALIVLYVVAVGIIIGSVTGVNVAPLLATSTVITVVLGLALQDTLGNLFSGLALSVEQPFVVGEWILIDVVEGRIESLTWRSVHLRTFSGDMVTVPNAVIAKARVQNFSRPNRLHARNVSVIVPANADPVVVEQAARAALATVTSVRKEPAPKVWLVEHTPLMQRWVLNVWLDDFAIHDDSESDVRKAFVTQGLAAGLQMPLIQAVLPGPAGS